MTTQDISWLTQYAPKQSFETVWLSPRGIEMAVIHYDCLSGVPTFARIGEREYADWAIDTVRDYAYIDGRWIPAVVPDCV